MKKLIALAMLVFSMSAVAENSFIQCDAKIPGYERFKMIMNFEDHTNPGMFLFVIQGGVMGHWQIRGINVESDDSVTRTKFMMNENEFAVLTMPNEIFHADFNETFESSVEMMNGKHPTTCFAVK